MKPWFIYIVRCIDGSLYTGVSTDVNARVEQHNEGLGARHTRDRRPVTLVWIESAESEKVALKRERQIKGWTRAKKENLITYGHPKAACIESER